MASGEESNTVWYRRSRSCSSSADNDGFIPAGIVAGCRSAVKLGRRTVAAVYDRQQSSFKILDGHRPPLQFRLEAKRHAPVYVSLNFFAKRTWRVELGMLFVKG